MLARALCPGDVARGRGHLVFISSLSGKAASPASSVYSATKFGLRGFALALREDLRRDGVGVSVVPPGFIRDAGMFADTGVQLPPGVGTHTPEQVAASMIDAIEHNRAEAVVAPALLRAGADFAAVAPGRPAVCSDLPVVTGWPARSPRSARQTNLSALGRGGAVDRVSWRVLAAGEGRKRCDDLIGEARAIIGHLGGCPDAHDEVVPIDLFDDDIDRARGSAS